MEEIKLNPKDLINMLTDYYRANKQKNLTINYTVDRILPNLGGKPEICASYSKVVFQIYDGVSTKAITREELEQIISIILESRGFEVTGVSLNTTNIEPYFTGVTVIYKEKSLEEKSI